MLNFLLLYVPVHPLKESYLLKFIQDAVKLQCLLPCYVVCFHYLIQSVLGMLLDVAKFNRGGYIDCITCFMYFSIQSYIACFHYFIHLQDPSYSGSPAPVPLHPAPVPSPRERLPALHHSEACSGQWILPCCQEIV